MTEHESQDDRPPANDPPVEPTEAAERAGESQGGEPGAPEVPKRHAPIVESPEPAMEDGQPAGGGMPIVGVGASAGGLEAMSQLLDALEDPSSLAMIFAQHLSPDHASSLAHLLGAHTSMTVVDAEDGVPIEANHLYVIRPGTYLEVEGGLLRVAARPGAEHTPGVVDRLLCSLAEQAGPRAVGVVLSGTGSDGTKGLSEIRAAGGMTFVQDPDSAQHDGMPRCAIAGGVVDRALPPAELAQAIGRVRGGATGHPQAPALAAEVDDRALRDIFQALYSQTRMDFSGYKPGTIRRRLSRRMSVLGINSTDAYRDLVVGNAEEARELSRDILVHVTRFFREPESFEALAQTAVPRLLQSRQDRDDPIRVWTAGCATGEEAYSVAILLFEELEKAKLDTPVQIFGTDISGEAIQIARDGTYPESITGDLSADRLRRFFNRSGDQYKINREVRNHCVFAEHDVTRDPPYSRMDLVICRNLLIYLGEQLQERVLSMLHYALKGDGLLMLGPSESVGSHGELFSLIDKHGRLYAKREVNVQPYHVPAPFAERQPIRRSATTPTRKRREREGDDTPQARATALLLDRYGPPAVVVDDQYDIVQVRGRTGTFLEPAPGHVSVNLLKMAREGLVSPLRTALHQAHSTQGEVEQHNVSVRSDGQQRMLDVTVAPLPTEQACYYLVVFYDRQTGRLAPARSSQVSQQSDTAPPPDTEAESQRVKELEQEVTETRNHLQSVIHDLEMTNEDLQSANEEVVSSNEELQSTNEELDTAREELQSTNEELNTLNDELRRRNEELTQSNSDLVNLINNVQIPIVIVDRGLRIRRFTPAAEQLMNLRPGDVDRPIRELNLAIECPDLESQLSAVIEQVEPLDRDVREDSGRWYSMRIRPYTDVNKRIDGAVISFFDVDAARRLQNRTEAERNFAQSIVQTVRQPLLVLDPDLRVEATNRAFCQTFAVEERDIVGQLIYDLGNGQWDIPRLRELLDQVQQAETTFEDYLVEHTFPGIGPKQMLLNARRLAFEPDQATRLLLAIEDVTDRPAQG